MPIQSVILDKLNDGFMGDNKWKAAVVYKNQFGEVGLFFTDDSAFARENIYQIALIKTVNRPIVWRQYSRRGIDVAKNDLKWLAELAGATLVAETL